jgi:hypothetical protein
MWPPNCAGCCGARTDDSVSMPRPWWWMQFSQMSVLVCNHIILRFIKKTIIFLHAKHQLAATVPGYVLIWKKKSSS